MTHVVIIGAGPGGYEAALVAAQLGSQVTVIDRDGPGGSAVLTDCVPSKTLIATADLLAVTAEAGSLGIRVHGEAPGVGTPVPGGLTYREAHLLLELVAARANVGSVDVVEINPILDSRNRTAKIGVELVASLLGQTIY